MGDNADGDYRWVASISKRGRRLLAHGCDTWRAFHGMEKEVRDMADEGSKATVFLGRIIPYTSG